MSIIQGIGPASGRLPKALEKTSPSRPAVRTPA
jgi:hypothetical protein